MCVYVYVCVCASVRACVRVCVCVCLSVRVILLRIRLDVSNRASREAAATRTRTYMSVCLRGCVSALVFWNDYSEFEEMSALKKHEQLLMPLQVHTHMCVGAFVF